MSTEKLQTIGFKELNESELRDVEGGIAILAINALYCYALYGAFMAGYDAGRG